MDKNLFVMLMENKKPLDLGVIQRHVGHLKRLDAAGQLLLCGPFTDFGGGMVILRAQSYEEANKLSKSDPYIAEGYKTFYLRTLEVANQENGYLLD